MERKMRFKSELRTLKNWEQKVGIVSRNGKWEQKVGIESGNRKWE